MSDEYGGEIDQLINVLEVATVISITVVWSNGFATFEEAVVALLMMIAIVLVWQ